MSQFIQQLEALLELNPDTLTPNTELRQLAGWDSMAVVGFLALADGTYGKAVSPSAIKECKTVSDLSALVGQS